MANEQLAHLGLAIGAMQQANSAPPHGHHHRSPKPLATLERPPLEGASKRHSNRAPNCPGKLASADTQGLRCHTLRRARVEQPATAVRQ
eukprot:3646474-Karenia_brevis.AAC.1